MSITYYSRRQSSRSHHVYISRNVLPFKRMRTSHPPSLICFAVHVRHKTTPPAGARKTNPSRTCPFPLSPVPTVTKRKVAASTPLRLLVPVQTANPSRLCTGPSESTMKTNHYKIIHVPVQTPLKLCRSARAEHDENKQK